MKPIQIGDIVGDYQVIDIAGSGGMGAVFKIEHLITRRIEAMKLLPPGLRSDSEQVHRFEREIQVQARLHHPNIVALYNAVRDGDSMGLVMEFVEGESLQRILEGGPLPVETALNFTGQVLRALAYAHDAGVIHRDVAPANIIITPDLVAMLTDFGLARGVTDLRLSISGVPVGSPWYMSPEQVRGSAALDVRTDLYAMGAVLHEMLTGGKLFAVEGAFAVMRAHVETEPALPSSRNPMVPAALDQVVRKAVAKDPAMRFQSADEFRLALEKVGAGARPVVAPTIPREKVQDALPVAPSRLLGWHASRAAVLMALLVPAAMVAGFYTLRNSPATVRAGVAERKPAAAVISPHNAGLAVPAAAAPVAAEAPGVVPPPAAEVAAEKPLVRPRAKSASQTVRRAAKPEPIHAIRVTGGELHPAQAMSAPSPVARRLEEAPEPPHPTADSVEAPEGAAPSEELGSAPELATTPQISGREEPQNTGNRFVKALGKVNPFRRRAKTPLEKD